MKKARSYSERMFRDIAIGNLTDDEARLAIECLLEGTDYKFSKDLGGDLIHDTGGYPSFIQFFGKEIRELEHKR